MEVTRRNFHECFDDVKESIQQATFFAIDGEFTGLDHPDHGHPQPFDTPEERYQKLSKGSVEFLLFQFGLCTFKHNPETGKFEARPFNFYIFPKPFSKESPDHRFLCQSSSIDFLASQGFDFNKVFREGIPYLTPHEEQTLRDSLEQKHQQNSQFASSAYFSPLENKDIAIPEEQKDFVDRVCQMVTDFQENEEVSVLDLPPCNGFQRKLLYQTIRNKFSSNIHLETKTGEKKERFIVVTKISGDDDLKKKELERHTSEMKDLNNAVGFSRVIRLLAQSGKLLIGHNMLLDLIHILHQFHAPLPTEYEDFKSYLHAFFPKLIDTKLMANINPFRELISSSSLGELWKIVQVDPFKAVDIDLPEEFSNYNASEQQLHEAGYDAFITGLCFISMSQFLGDFEDCKKQLISPLSQLLEPFNNKLFMSRVQDIPYINITGTDLQPDRGHVFHVTFPKEWKAADLYQLFMPFGNVQLSWINDNSAYVALHNKDNAEMVLKTLNQAETYRVISYSESKRKKVLSTESHQRKRRHLILEQDSVEESGNVKKVKTLNVDRVTAEYDSMSGKANSTLRQQQEKSKERGKNMQWEPEKNEQTKEKLFEENDDW
ncbi:PARN [Acanthosepion pharaonis]|uniref:Poly(A)-specific ribonuclease PARN n=1 Tax=Acanthosepion pharaonis TaxID=158019 RepID=A0A812ENQ3_ACAPH|nr:PARN [Sepia pharaonis]